MPTRLSLVSGYGGHPRSVPSVAKEAPKNIDEAGRDDEEEPTQKERAVAPTTISGTKVTVFRPGDIL